MYSSNPHLDYDSTSPSTPDAASGLEDKHLASLTSTLNTKLSLDKNVDRPTPRAQTRQEVEDEWKRSRRTSSLEGMLGPMLVCSR